MLLGLNRRNPAEEEPAVALAARKDVPDHAAANAGQHAHDCDHHGIDAEIHRLLRADDSENRQSDHVEK